MLEQETPQNEFLLHKLIQSCALSAFSKKKKQVKQTILQNYLLHEISYSPFQKEFNILSWDEILSILEKAEADERKRLFSIKSNNIEILKTVSRKLQTKKLFNDELKMLNELTIIELAVAFRKIKNQKKSLSLVMEEVKKQRKKVSLKEAKKNASKDIVFVNTHNNAEKFLSELSRHKIKQIGLDCEGVNLGINGRLTLVQISANGKQYLFDMLKESKASKQAIHSAVKQVLGDVSITKVIHDCRSDLCGLYKDFGITVSSIVDTSILYQIIANKTRDISFNDLCKIYYVPGNEFKEIGKEFHTSGAWGSGFWTSDMLNYAAGDVRTIVHLYQTMMGLVKPELQKPILSEMDSKLRSLWLEVLHSLNQEPKEEVHVHQKIAEEEINQPNETSIVSKPVSLKKDQSFNTTIINQIDSFLDLFPKNIQERISAISEEDIPNLIEVAMDKGRPYELFYYHKKGSYSDPSFVVQQEEIEQVINKISFGSDNRAGIDGSLHRISAMLNRNAQIIGLTLRVGRAVIGRSKIFSDLIEQGKSILLLGKPGSGKTTFIRDFANTLSETRRVVVVDTSCEIGGFGDIPHVAIGKARRMQVADIRKQQEVMIQAVQNHTPEVIVIDEIGTRDEVSTARTIAQRGVILCGSAHGDMKSILKNPILCDLLGGVESVIMSDRNATRDGEKMRLQLKADPVFDVVIQLPDDTNCNEWKIFSDLRTTVQNILAKRPFKVEIRKLEGDELTSSHLVIG